MDAKRQSDHGESPAPAPRALWRAWAFPGVKQVSLPPQRHSARPPTPPPLKGSDAEDEGPPPKDQPTDVEAAMADDRASADLRDIWLPPLQPSASRVSPWRRYTRSMFSRRPSRQGRHLSFTGLSFARQARVPILRSMQMYPAEIRAAPQRSAKRTWRVHFLRGRAYELYSVATCLLAALSVGTHLGWMLPMMEKEAKLRLEGRFGLSEDEKEFIDVAMQIGMLVTPLPIGILMDLVGRRAVLLGSAAPLLCAWILAMVATTPLLLFFARLIAGLGAGIVYTAAPVYLSEVADPLLRGVTVTLFVLATNLGILLSYCVGPFVRYTTSVAVNMVFPLAFFTVFIFATETPVYYMLKEHTNHALAILIELRRDKGREEYEALVQSTMYLRHTGIGFQDVCVDRATQHAFTMISLIMITKELSGISALLSVEHRILEKPITKLETKYALIIVGGMQVLGAAVAVCLVDVMGRRPLLFVSQLGLAILLGMIAICFTFLDCNAEECSTVNSWVVFMFLMLVNVLYALGPGSLPWTLLPEMVAPAVRASSSSVVCLISVFFYFLERQIFAALKEAWGLEAAFWACAIVAVAASVLVGFLLPETKARLVRDIVEELHENE